MKRIICKIFGHQWHCVARPTTNSSYFRCFRCGASRRESWNVAKKER